MGGGPQWEIAGCSGLQRQRAASGSNSGRRHLMAAGSGQEQWQQREHLDFSIHLLHTIKV